MAFDVISVGNAIVDMIAETNDETLIQNSLTKGSMMLVDAAESATRQMLIDASKAKRVAGGSAANTAAAIASLGMRSAYIGKVAADDLGTFFNEDMAANGVAHYHGHDKTENPTANCLAMITPDGERTMSTFLGACRELSPVDIDENLIVDSAMVFLEGYLLDAPNSAAAFNQAAHLARKHSKPLAITLSDKFCVQRNHKAFTAIGLVSAGPADILIGNHAEMSMLFGTEEITEMRDRRGNQTPTLVVTHGSKGSSVIDTNGLIQSVPAAKISKLVDLVGAGDAFAAGFLTGRVLGLDNLSCLVRGNRAAGVVVESKGARPHTKLELVV